MNADVSTPTHGWTIQRIRDINEAKFGQNSLLSSDVFHINVSISEPASFFGCSDKPLASAF